MNSFYREKIYPNLYHLYEMAEYKYYEKYTEKTPILNSDQPLFYQNYPYINITKGEYDYEYFNFCYLHNLLSLFIYCMKHKHLPYISINQQNPDCIQWDWYFEQPFSQESFSVPPAATCERVKCFFVPHFSDIYDQKKRSLWCNIYKNFVRFNKKTSDYINQEYNELAFSSRRVLGVICRGTDYLRLKPAGHPIQPSISDIIQECKKIMSEYNYTHIYLATEERKIRDIFEESFPNLILENRRQYYDDIYDQNPNIQFIKEVKFNRENNNFLSGLEYLSSITLLSRCRALIGGNCGGTLGAIFLNDNKYEYTHIFDLGVH